MTIQDIGLFSAIGAKIEYLNQRQSVISQNIANSDTPNYRPKDIVETDFARLIKNNGNGVMQVSLAATNEKHMGQGGQTLNVQDRKQKQTYEVAPAGNAVIMEEQLMNSGRNMMDYTLMLNVYQKQVGMMRTALGSR